MEKFVFDFPEEEVGRRVPTHAPPPPFTSAITAYIEMIFNTATVHVVDTVCVGFATYNVSRSKPFVGISCYKVVFFN